jgi:hypothetical protein
MQGTKVVGIWCFCSFEEVAHWDDVCGGACWWLWWLQVVSVHFITLHISVNCCNGNDTDYEMLLF